jgi:hypothetical protein
MEYNVVFSKSFNIKAETLHEAEELGYDQFAEFLVREMQECGVLNTMMGEFGCIVKEKGE